MRVNITSTFYLFAFLFLLNISCQREIDNPFDDNGNNPGLDIWKTAGVTGQVIEANGLPVEGAEVRFGSSTTRTDINGYFSFVNASFNTGEAFVTVKKQGFFTGSRTFYPNEGSNNYVKIKLLPRTKAGEIESEFGGDIELRNGMIISFPADAIATASGAAYNGDFEVAASYLDPTSNDINERMPGDLRGVALGNEVILKSYGMIAVELTSPAGQPLNIKAGSTATLTFPIPASLSGTAPAAIPLWYFDESTGLWKAEGLATKIGDQYVGEVSHFSFWNVDVPCEFIKLSLKVVSPTNQPVAGAKVKVTSLVDGTSAYDYTDNTGHVEGAVPKSHQLKVEVFDNCHVVVHTQTVGPFTADNDLGSVQINTSVSLQTISGTVATCAGSPLASGTVMVKLNNNQADFTNIQNGQFSITFLTCAGATSAQVTAIDPAGQQQGNPVTVNLTNPSLNIGQIQACGVSLAAYVTFSENGGPTMTWTNTNSEIILALEDQSDVNPNGDYGFYVAAGDTSENLAQPQPIIQLILSRPPGPLVTPAILKFNEEIGIITYDQNAGVYNIYTPVDPANGVTITTYGGIGQPVIGTASGQFNKEVDFGGPTSVVNLNCTFKVLQSDPAYWLKGSGKSSRFAPFPRILSN